MSGQDNPPRDGQKPAPGVASDQSMEDILASIRRILNEGEAEAAAVPAPEEAAAAARRRFAAVIPGRSCSRRP